MDFQLKSNKADVKKRLSTNEEAALNAMGQTAVEITTSYMEGKYYSPIYDTGDLIRDVNFKVLPSEKAIGVGNSLNYAPWVHNGTDKMKARPYLKDAIQENRDALREVAREQLNKGF